ncbi:MOSC N-terminal beta barrel domain-containing protein [Caballeronia sp. LZ001]|uniref:MOSC domain-containing protein n=1 Tax=Caballeronia sp. LZ001 TaxID=3038553 RepID=UPI00285DE215|nr:MOSC N-terminal beta barrel domain-containing protein [Caballeronia sp. LZ001]MDR5800146.1 MOSC N-terminal beta barrel domain-containing protein [Caballeronia sp. LZ001]
MPTISALFVYPVKSCGAIALDCVQLAVHGFPWDRHWMVIDENGRFVSQREFPAMARIVPTLTADALVLNSPDTAEPLEVPLARAKDPARVAVNVWRDHFEALDEGVTAARWFSARLGVPVRLVRFADDVTRLASKTWTRDADAPTQFADGFPLLVTNHASLDDLNARLEAKGAPRVPMNRFRPNVVLSGLDAFEEDFIDTISVDGIVLRMVKPCARCPITTVDQTHGVRDAQWPNEPLDVMMGWRANARVDGGLTFGQNAIALDGAGRELRVGASVDYELSFSDDF